MEKEKVPPMSVREAGRRGGNTTKEKYGLEYYSAIGKKGATQTASQQGPEFYAEIGKKGGGALLEKRGRAYFQELGKLSRKGKRVTLIPPDPTP